jgi:spoIIIJ-associated protein
MKKIEAPTLESAYAEACRHFECSVTALDIVVVQHPKKGFLGFMSQNAVIVVQLKEVVEEKALPEASGFQESGAKTDDVSSAVPFPEEDDEEEDEDDYYLASEDDLDEIAAEVEAKINALFATVCFELEPISVSVYDDSTLLIEFNGEDAALLIGKEGYRYKALSYMLFNWINAEYQLQLRLEIAEFLKNQEESVARYLAGVFDNIDRDGRAQTRVLDGVLVQIALKQLRERYHDKYVAIRTTRDGGKYIIINDYHSY